MFLLKVDMSETMKDRIKAVMESQHQTQKNFASFIGVGEGTLSNILNERTKPTLNIVEAIKNKIPSVSTDWLLFGRGSMYEDEAKNSTAPSNSAQGEVSEPMLDFDGSSGGERPTSQDHIQMQPVVDTPRNITKTVVKYIDKPKRNITEIRVFYDDQTWETFVPK